MESESKKKQVVIITGSTGLIGNPTVKRLADTFHVVGFDRRGSPHPRPEAECVCVDITDDESVEAALARVRYAYGHRIASVIHLAAYYDFSGEPSDQYEEVTVRGTERLLRALQDFDVAQFVFSSTILVHAPTTPGRPINEDWPLDPKWDYPKSKVRTEEVIRKEHGPIPLVILRVAGVYDDRGHSPPLANQMQRIYERTLTSHLFPGDVTHGQAFVHLDDVVDALWLCVEKRRELPPEAVLLVGEDETVSYDELQRSFDRLIHGEEEDTRHIPKALAKAGAWVEDHVPGEEPFIKPWMIDLADDHLELDIRRARRLLGWDPKRRLRQTLPTMVDYLKADPAGFYKENKLAPPPPAHPESESKHAKRPMNAEHSGRETKAPAAESAPGPNESVATKKEPRQDMKGSVSKGSDSSEMAMQDHQGMMRQMLAKWVWRDFANIILGLWLVTAPVTFGYRSASMTWSDIASGALIVALAILTLWPRFDLARWGICFTGIWLLFAPLVFWAPDSAAYANDTLVGALVIAFSVLIPMMPGKAHHMLMMKPGPEIPPGWTYNPSTWLQRGPIIALAVVSFFISRYLAAHQLGYVSHAWEPFFAGGAGTRRVLESEVSKMWPISDAGLGAVSYLLEALSGFMGGRSRWRTMPWMVAMFGFLVVPLGATSIVLVMLQPVAVGAWCTLCLVTAALMLTMIPLAVDEVVAMAQFLRRARREGKPFWRTFWLGDTIEGALGDDRGPGPDARLVQRVQATAWGVSVPWTLALSAAVGVWTMAAPAVLGSSPAVASNATIAGALVATVAVTAMGEVTRAARFLNILLGLWVAVAPWFVSGSTTRDKLAYPIGGLALLALSVPRGRLRDRYGGWDRYVR